MEGSTKKGNTVSQAKGDTCTTIKAKNDWIYRSGELHTHIIDRVHCTLSALLLA